MKVFLKNIILTTVTVTILLSRITMAADDTQKKLVKSPSFELLLTQYPAIKIFLNEINFKFCYYDDPILNLLHQACLIKHVAVVKSIVAYLSENLKKEDLKAYINKANQFAFTALHLAIYNNPNEAGTLEIVKLLVDIGANVNAGNLMDVTPLHFYVKKGQDEKIAEYLIQNGADIENKSFYGATPLHFAAQAGNLFMVKYLVKKGANTTALQSSGSTMKNPQEMAELHGRKDVVNYLASLPQASSKLKQLK